VSPDRRYFVYAERNHLNPKIYFVEYPSYKVAKVLQGGAAKGYSQLNFSANGSRLASVATDPDYTLTIWDWEDEKAILRSKAFSQVSIYFRCAF
jgi:hypothetical protein